MPRASMLRRSEGSATTSPNPSWSSPRVLSVVELVPSTDPCRTVFRSAKVPISEARRERLAKAEEADDCADATEAPPAAAMLILRAWALLMGTLGPRLATLLKYMPDDTPDFSFSWIVFSNFCRTLLRFDMVSATAAAALFWVDQGEPRGGSAFEIQEEAV